MVQLASTGGAQPAPLDFEEDGAHKTWLQRLALTATAATEKWFPDAYVIALVALLVISVAALAIGAPAMAIITAVGDGYWKLNNFTYQMAMVVLTGFAVASCAPVKRGIQRLAQMPRTGPGASCFILFLSLLANLLHWGFGLMFSVFLVMAITARKDLRVDVRAAAAAGFAGNSASMIGLSSSAALLHTTPGSLPPELLKVSGIISLNDTIFLWQNGVSILIMTAVALFVAYATAPRGATVRTATDLGIDTSSFFAETLPTGTTATPQRPGDWLGNSPLLTLAISGLMFTWIISKVAAIGFGATVSNLNNYLFISLAVAFLLHWRVKNFLKAMSDAVPAVGGILIQFPIYAAVASVLMLAQNAEGQTVSSHLGHFFAEFVTKDLLPPVVAVYSIVVGIFIPSAGAKWIVEAPYILDAGNKLQSHLGWLINAYGGAETLANLLNPFWMLPMLGLMRLRVRSVVGFTFMYFVFLAPAMVLSYWLLGFTLDYHPPVLP
jgi:short-chain fatty acids transporter